MLSGIEAKEKKNQSRFQRIIRVKTIGKNRATGMIFLLDIKTFIFNEDIPGISKYPCASSDNPLIRGKFALS